MMTEEEMIEEVYGWFVHEEEKFKKEFLSTSKEELILYHNSLGRKIRNELKLWEREWKPVINSNIDYAEDHPDQISHRVIVAVWERAKEAEQSPRIGGNPLPLEAQEKVWELVQWLDKEYDACQGSTSLYWGLSYLIATNIKTVKKNG